MTQTLAMLLAVACAASACTPSAADTGVQEALATIRPETIRGHMRFLADDLLEGRATGERGYEIAARYVAAQMDAVGLEPAFHGRWYQQVPFRTSETTHAELAIVDAGTRRPLEAGVDFVLGAGPFRTDTAVEAPVVFAGYGITAPEVDHDDYDGLDVKGKAVAMLSGAPRQFPSHLRAYYAQSREKLRNAAARGAIGVLTLFPPSESARFPWDLTAASARKPNVFWLDESGSPMQFPASIQFRASLNRPGAEALFARAGRGLDVVLAEAEAGMPRGLPLNVSVALRHTVRHGRMESPNVAGVLRGSDPVLRDEYFVYVAHLDHLGADTAAKGDRINNGAYDNASGVAIMLEVADAFARMRSRPARSIIFLAATAEEVGLLGAEYFVHRPPVPLERIVANTSLDMFLMLFPLRDVIAFGAEHSSLGGVVERAARQLGVKVSPDPMPEEVIFIRSDQYRFVEQGIPAVFLVHGLESGDPSRDGAALTAAWRRERYHRPGDDMNQEMDFQAGVDFGRLNLLVGYEVASARERPAWKPGDFFGGKFAPRRP